MRDALIGPTTTGMNTQNYGSRFDVVESFVQWSFDVVDLCFGPGSHGLRRCKNEIEAPGTNTVEKANVFHVMVEHRKQNSDQPMATTQVSNRFAKNPLSNASEKLKTLQELFKRQRPTLAQFSSKQGRQIVSWKPSCIGLPKSISTRRLLREFCRVELLQKAKRLIGFSKYVA